MELIEALVIEANGSNGEQFISVQARVIHGWELWGGGVTGLQTSGGASRRRPAGAGVLNQGFQE